MTQKITASLDLATTDPATDVPEFIRQVLGVGLPAGVRLVGLSVYTRDRDEDIAGLAAPAAPVAPPPAASTEPAPEPARRGRPRKDAAAPAAPPADQAPADGTGAADPDPTPPAGDPTPPAGDPNPGDGPPPGSGDAPTVEELRAVVAELLDMKRAPKIKAILAGVPAASVSDIPSGQRAAVLRQLQMALVE